jgi:hypothetical protein
MIDWDTILKKYLNNADMDETAGSTGTEGKADLWIGRCHIG